jgi:nucleobase:cation symporter-1, NCS1 family
MTAEALPHERGDMPTREGDLKIEQRGIEPIPLEARYGSVARVFTVWFTPNLVPAAFFIGTLAALDFLKIGFVTGVAAILVGNLVGSMLVGYLATMGPRTGMAQIPFARRPFGKSIVAPGLLNWLSCIGWDGINNVFGAAALTLLFPVLPFPAWLAIIVLATMALGVFGYEAIHQFEKYAAVVLAAMFVVLTVAIAGQASTGRTDGLTGLNQIGAFITFSTISASFVLAWSLYASDYTRYLPANSSRGRIFAYTVLGLTLSAGWIEILGLAVADKSTGPAVGTINTILGGGLLGGLALLAVGIGTIAVNALNDYTGSLSLLAAGIRVPRVVSAIVVAVLGFGFTLFLNAGDLALKFENYLLFLSYWIAPWAAVVLVDWMQNRERFDARVLMDLRRLHNGIPALVALVAGFLVGLPFQTSAFGSEIAKATGLPINTIAIGNLSGADLAYVVGFIVAGVISWVGSRYTARSPGEPEPAEAAAT